MPCLFVYGGALDMSVPNRLSGPLFWVCTTACKCTGQLEFRIAVVTAMTLFPGCELFKNSSFSVVEALSVCFSRLAKSIKGWRLLEGRLLLSTASKPQHSSRSRLRNALSRESFSLGANNASLDVDDRFLVASSSSFAKDTISLSLNIGHQITRKRYMHSLKSTTSYS